MTDKETGGRKRAAKDAGAYRTISEVSAEIGVPAHILRFWETRFPQLKPLQRGGNRRYYRPSDITLAACLHELLHRRGMTVKGVQMLIREHGADRLPALCSDDNSASIVPGAAELPAVATAAVSASDEGVVAVAADSLYRIRARLQAALAV